MRTVIMTLTVLGLSLSACKKLERKVEMDDVKKVNVGRQPDAAANPRNPYDSVGFQHNAIMDYIEAHRPKETMDRRLSVRLIQEYYHQLGRSTSPVNFELARQTVKAAQEDIHGLIIAKTGYSKPVKEALDSLITMLEELSEQVDYKIVKAAVFSFENDILTSKLSVDEQAVILKTSSIARYSAYYWLSRYEPAQTTSISSIAKWKDIVRWFAGAINDIGGFIESMDVGYAAECSDDARETVDYCMPEI